MGTMRRLTAVTMAVVALCVVVAGCSSSSSSGGGASASPVASAPALADPAATGKELVTQFMTMLQKGDKAALETFLASGFQVQRADGSGATKPEYLANLIKVNNFAVGDKVVAVQDGDVLTVRWSVQTAESVDGTPLGTTPAPRLSVFVWQDGTWHLVAHSNFNKPA